MGATISIGGDKRGSEVIHDYRSSIAHAIDELKVQFRKTEGAIEQVQESWMDANCKEFCQNFEQDKQEILDLCKVLSNYEQETLYQFEIKLRGYEDTHMRRL